VSQFDGFYDWLQNTAVSQTVSTTPWIIPALQTLHILAVASIVSSVFLLNLRLMGVIGGEQSPAAVARRFLPFIWWPLPVLLATGSLLISSEPARSLGNPTFALKIGLLLLAIGTTLIYQRRLRADPNYWESRGSRRVTVKIIAGLSLALWTGIVLAGRWIAYTQP